MSKRAPPLRRWLKPLAALAGMALVVLLVPSLGETRTDLDQPSAVKTALPGPCLLPAPEMRRQHKGLLYEERTNAVRHGIRNPETSLTRCVACHAVHDEAGQPVTYEDERHFCRSCHMQVAIAPDCFSCHLSTPMTLDKAEEKP